MRPTLSAVGLSLRLHRAAGKSAHPAAEPAILEIEIVFRQRDVQFFRRLHFVLRLDLLGVERGVAGVK